jgi:membrane protease YdiL (CAAX protease family)
LREALGQRPHAWLALVPLVAAALLLMSTLLLAELVLLRGFALVLLLVSVGQLVVGLIGSSQVYSSWTARAPAGASFAVGNDLKLVPVGLVAAGLALRGSTREQLFLRIGDLRARAGLPFTKRTIPWWRLALITILLAYGYTFVHVTATRGANPSALTGLVGLAPVILVGAAVNAFCEEFLFRNSLIAQVAPVTGKLGALWLTGLRFGIGHWYGNPSGPLGVAGATLLGFLLGKSMLDTRGSGWAWIIHLIGDVMIFALVATAAPAVGQPG